MRHLDAVDRWLVGLFERFGIAALRISVGLVFVWFGALKFFPGLSPAEPLLVRTTDVLSFGLLAPETARLLIAALETAIGVGLLWGRATRVVLALLAFQMVGTLMPLALFPRDVFVAPPFVPTLTGQYILKNLVLIAAALVIGATVRGARLRPPARRPEPRAERPLGG